nr:RNA-directed DNA polymerase, eukaryota, nucleotide-binding alpha-beta plait domain protein [Tanacetum cinerariifolium]
MIYSSDFDLPSLNYVWLLFYRFCQSVFDLSYASMGSNRFQSSIQSKFDLTAKISKSVFVSNFPEGCSNKDLWKVCSDFGTVVDVFIPNKKSKPGKRAAQHCKWPSDVIA